MPDKVKLQALQASIKEWQGKAAGDDAGNIALGRSSCPLCRVYDPVRTQYPERPACAGCPIAEKAGKIGCENTPYLAARSALSSWYNMEYARLPELQRTAAKNRWRAAAEEMILFMTDIEQSLLSSPELNAHPLVKELEWSQEFQPGRNNSNYNHVRSITPVGIYVLEWKSWKEHGSVTVYLYYPNNNGSDFISAEDNLDAAKTAATTHFRSIVLACLKERLDG